MDHNLWSTILGTPILKVLIARSRLIIAQYYDQLVQTEMKRPTLRKVSKCLCFNGIDSDLDDEKFRHLKL